MSRSEKCARSGSSLIGGRVFQGVAGEGRAPRRRIEAIHTGVKIKVNTIYDGGPAKAIKCGWSVKSKTSNMISFYGKPCAAIFFLQHSSFSVSFGEDALPTATGHAASCCICGSSWPCLPTSRSLSIFARVTRATIRLGNQQCSMQSKARRSGYAVVYVSIASVRERNPTHRANERATTFS